MEELKIVVIGGVAVGPKAAARAKRCNSNAKVTLIERGTYLSYGACGLPYYIGGAVGEMEDLMTTAYGTLRDQKYFSEVKDINVMPGHEATKIDRANKKVIVKELATGEVKEIPYDKLVLATGAKPVTPKMPGVEGKGVFKLTTPQDGLAIKDYCLKNDVDNVIVMGAGLIGLEFAENIVNWGPSVTIVEMQDRVLPGLLDKEMSISFRKYLESEDMVIHTDAKINEVVLDEEGKVKGVETEKGFVEGQLLLVSIGVRPNLELAEEAGLEVDRSIIVNEYMQTSDPDIYAGGDCVASVNRVTGQNAYVPLGSTANKHGRIIGTNITGGKEKFPGIVGTGIAKVFDWSVARTGLSQPQAESLGYDTISVVVAGHDKPFFYPGSSNVLIKLIADKNTRKVLGAQLIGPGDINGRINQLVVAISLGCTASEVANFDYAYAPPFSEAVDVIIHAGNVLNNLIDGTMNKISFEEAEPKLNAEGTVFLDVRTELERQRLPVPGENIIHIPFDNFRDRMNEIPKDKEIICCCDTGTRANEVQMVLKRNGYNDAKLLEAGVWFWPWN
ncbi:NADPH-dependent 2,4-dienoyl-CoA reductase, sulfur reductase [Desulfonispora thiosulfatigenes DSM 11270]|uniref:NADPH-dependent 2,4-dienoyl-CoA reductase, sulfur reductase n=1 Tax=Desulfonispora thiosulfatigenes DSM 11270 TaxID=656914 RepID=A0A1W1V6W3_DESTI|nr:FAD-dependent oxidoreductase [Desulfonispora thiosulfatigenes]SMB89157.1 NADPH-dependent 2,4-dienoyl-CoA reductase, sulfur reductase [Desulfonispora thiosulfatigenes DSM 11270]